MLLDLIEGKLEPPQHILMPTQLTIRDSCGALSQKSQPAHDSQ
jgi:hypothetical protein